MSEEIENNKTSAEAATEQTEAVRRDYAREAYECFIKNADPETTDADPVSAIRRVFDRRASEDLKARVAADGKTAEGAYAFLWSVARLMPHDNNGCHISPETGYAIAMHYFEDVPACEKWEPGLKREQKEKEAAKSKAEEAARIKGHSENKAVKTKNDNLAKRMPDDAQTEMADSEDESDGPGDPSATEPVEEPTPAPKSAESMKDARDRANGQGFLFDL